jgi:hypothetical protein
VACGAALAGGAAVTGLEPADADAAGGDGCELGSALGAGAAEALGAGASTALGAGASTAADAATEGEGCEGAAEGAAGSGPEPNNLSLLSTSPKIATTPIAPRMRPRRVPLLRGAGIEVETAGLRGNSPVPLFAVTCPGDNAATIPRAAAPSSAALEGALLRLDGGAALVDPMGAGGAPAPFASDAGKSPENSGLVPTSSIDPPASRSASSSSSAACFMTVCSGLGPSGATLVDFGKSGEGATGRGALEGEPDEAPGRGIGGGPPESPGGPSEATL